MEKEEWELTIQEKREIMKTLIEEHIKYSHISNQYLEFLDNYIDQLNLDLHDNEELIKIKTSEKELLIHEKEKFKQFYNRELNGLNEDDILRMINDLKNKVLNSYLKDKLNKNQINQSTPTTPTTTVADLQDQSVKPENSNENTIVSKEGLENVKNENTIISPGPENVKNENNNSTSPINSTPSSSNQNTKILEPLPKVSSIQHALYGIKVEDKNGNMVPVTSLWENKRSVVVIFRRFGCLICRIQAMDLSSIKPRLDSMGINLIGIGFESLGLNEFIQGGFFNGEIYIDKTRAVYRALNIKRMGFWESAIGLADSKFSTYRNRAKQMNIPSNFRGDGLQLGATLVVGPTPQGALYDFRQQKFTDIFDLNQVLNACMLPYPDENTKRDILDQSGLDLTVPKPVTVSVPSNLFSTPIKSDEVTQNPDTHNPFKDPNFSTILASRINNYSQEGAEQSEDLHHSSNSKHATNYNHHTSTTTTTTTSTTTSNITKSLNSINLEDTNSNTVNNQQQQQFSKSNNNSSNSMKMKTEHDNNNLIYNPY
eukprot:gene2223-2740_t